MRKICIMPSFWAVLGFLIFLGMGRQYSLLLLAAMIHEFGHGMVIFLYGNTIEEIRLIPGGVDIRYRERRFSYSADIMIPLAGPLANLLTAMIFSVLDIAKADYFIGLNLLLCFFNLLPLHPLDGGKALYAVMSCLWPIGGERAFFLFSAVLSALIFGVVCAGCFYDYQAWWSMVVFGYILSRQNIRWLFSKSI